MKENEKKLQEDKEKGLITDEEIEELKKRKETKESLKYMGLVFDVILVVVVVEFLIKPLIEKFL